MIDMNIEQSSIMWYFIQIDWLFSLLNAEPNLNDICYLIVSELIS